MTTLRTVESENKYQEYRKNNLSELCPLCIKEPIKKFNHWKIVYNDFPYDRIATVHHMLVPIRHVKEDGLNGEELNEMKYIKENHLMNNDYEFIIEATYKVKTVPSHFHLHLIITK